jgi:hypothetical protein
LDIQPNSLTYTTSDNQIGHFLPADIDLKDCSKGQTCSTADTEEILLCPITQDGCPTYYKCIVLEGTYPTTGDVSFIVRSNGATNGANTQEGVYISGISLYDGNKNPVAGAHYYRADGSTSVSDTQCTWEAEQARATVDSQGLSDDVVQICIAYQVNPNDVTRDANGEILNPIVQFWVEVSSVPCGAMINDAVSAATMVECGAGDRCMYFPYVLHGYTDAPAGSLAWFSGIAVSNLSDAIAVADMEVTVTLTDSAGTAFNGVIPAEIANGKVFSFSIDQLIAAMGWEPADGPAWLMVKGNFTIDGYSFVFEDNNGFGAGMMPRLLKGCSSLDLLK